jgi:tetratricopeptide (TPR) repeat protein
MAFNKVKALQEAEKLVGEGNVTLAIRHYLQIIEREPTDYILLNTVGDLYLREKNVAEALRHFNKLADTYTREGFTVKAIAIYKKIQKLDPGRVEPLVKLAELYAMQGLSREAREQLSTGRKTRRTRRSKSIAKSFSLIPRTRRNGRGSRSFASSWAGRPTPRRFTSKRPSMPSAAGTRRTRSWR